MTQEKIIRIAAVSLLIGFAVSLMWGVWSLRRQELLAEEVIRLHVIAATNREEDQALKLKVRDAVLEETAHWLDESDTRADAEKQLQAHLAELCQSAQKVVYEEGFDDDVTVWLAPEAYPTREYGTFSLPGGEYLSLRVVIGEGEGKNWWCVVFPPLCTAATAEELEKSGLTEEDLSLITQRDETYIIQFKSIELWESWSRGWKEWKNA